MGVLPHVTLSHKCIIDIWTYLSCITGTIKHTMCGRVGIIGILAQYDVFPKFTYRIEKIWWHTVVYRWFLEDNVKVLMGSLLINHDDVIKWKHFPRNWPLCGEFSPHKGQWRGALMCCLICVWIDGWVNNREAGDLSRHRGHYDIIVMMDWLWSQHG